MLTVLIDKVLREGWPITRDHRDRRRGCRWSTRWRNCRPARCRPSSALAADHRGADRALYHPAPGAERGSGRLARQAAAAARRNRRRGDRRRPDARAAMASDRALTARGFGKFLARRDALAIILIVGAVVRRPLSPARLLVEPAEQLRDPSQLYRGGAARDRPDLCDRRRRHRSFGRRGAGAWPARPPPIA